MTNRVVIAYVPVIHEGYHRFLTRHAKERPLFLIGSGMYKDYRPLAKDIRRLDDALVSSAIRSWNICSRVEVLTERSASRLAAKRISVTMPAEDVSYDISERFFEGCEVMFDNSIFLRWDRSKTDAEEAPEPTDTEYDEEIVRRLRELAHEQASGSVDWFRQVGATMLFADGELLSSVNKHLPTRQAAYVVGDPRINFTQGVNLELSTAMHAEAGLLARAARHGKSTEGGLLYVTDFPCPPCAKLIAACGVSTLFYEKGYARVDGMDVLRDAEVAVVRVAAAA